MNSGLASLGAPASSPRAKSLVTSTPASTSYLPAITAQLSDRSLWGFVVVGIVVCTISMYIFVTAEQAGTGDGHYHLIGDTATDTLGAFDSIGLIGVVGVASILASAYAFYRAFKSFEGDVEATAKQGYIIVLFALNMFLTTVWFNSFYVTGVVSGSEGTQTPTAVALGMALTSGLLVGMYWQSDRVCASMAAVNCVVSLVAAWGSYKLRQAMQSL